MSVSKERRDELRRDWLDCFSEPIVSVDKDEFRALLDLADERDRHRELLNDLHEYFDQRADADCEGDPPRFVPNEEMRWKVHIEDELKGR